MKSIRKHTGVALLVGSLFAASAASAATIAWSSVAYVNTGTNKTTLGTGQFNTTGTILYAENTGGSALTFDGINFTAGLAATNYFAPGGGNAAAFYVSGGTNNLAHTGTFANNVTPVATMTLGEGGVGPTFEIGQIYRLQFLLIDSRAAQAGRTVNFDGVSQGSFANRAGDNLGDGLLVTGVFTADATSQALNIDVRENVSPFISKGGFFNAMIISEIPEPSSALLGGLGLLALLRRRRA